MGPPGLAPPLLALRQPSAKQPAASARPPGTAQASRVQPRRAPLRSGWCSAAKQQRRRQSMAPGQRGPALTLRQPLSNQRAAPARRPGLKQLLRVESLLVSASRAERQRASDWARSTRHWPSSSARRQASQRTERQAAPPALRRARRRELRRQRASLARSPQEPQRQLPERSRLPKATRSRLSRHWAWPPGSMPQAPSPVRCWPAPRGRQRQPADWPEPWRPAFPPAWAQLRALPADWPPQRWPGPPLLERSMPGWRPVR